MALCLLAVEGAEHTCHLSRPSDHHCGLSVVQSNTNINAPSHSHPDPDSCPKAEHHCPPLRRRHAAYPNSDNYLRCAGPDQPRLSHRRGRRRPGMEHCPSRSRHGSHHAEPRIRHLHWWVQLHRSAADEPGIEYTFGFIDYGSRYNEIAWGWMRETTPVLLGPGRGSKVRHAVPESG